MTKCAYDQRIFVKKRFINRCLSRRVILVMLTYTSIWLSGCSDETAPTNGFNASISYIQWPRKYWGDNATNTSTDITFYVNKVDSTDSAYLWITARRKVDFGDAYDEPYYNRTLAFVHSDTLGISVSFGPTGYDRLGQFYYRIEVGLTDDREQLQEEDNAIEWFAYNMYGGNNKFRLEMDIEVINQSGIDLVNTNADKEEIERPYMNPSGGRFFPIAFSWSESDSSPDREGIVNDQQVLRDYKNVNVSMWSGGPPLSQVHHDALIGISMFTDVVGTPIIEMLGRSFNEYEVSFIARDQLDNYFGGDRELASRYTIAHELGHIVGRRLTDVCQESSEHNAPSGDPCLMTWLTFITVYYGGISYDYPSQQCVANTDGERLEAGFYDFCGKCGDKLSDLEFLLEDYSWHSFNPPVAGPEITEK